jgi:signal transduction histidine kinase
VLRLSIRKKILLGFVVVLLTFGTATLYGAWAVHTLGQQLRLVALGYSNLRLELQDQQTMQVHLQKRLLAFGRGQGQSAELLSEVAADRKLRKLRLATTQQHVADLQKNLPKQDARFLSEQVKVRLEALFALYEATDRATFALASEEEERAARLLQELSQHLTSKVIEVVNAGSRYEARAGLFSAALGGFALLTSVGVLLLLHSTLRPLRRLADTAKQVARGNYKERVPADSPDEVGALGKEFNAMAAALEEREQRLRRSEQLAAVGKMAAQITHEIRNPLTSIGLHAELLADDFAVGQPEAEQIAKAICKEVDRLTELTEQYLRFARLPEPRLEPIDLNALLLGVVGFLREEFARKGVTLRLSLSEHLPVAGADENQLRQVLLNLIRNAEEAMAEQPAEERTLGITTRTTPMNGSETASEDAHLVVDIEDSGPGVPQEKQRQIFEPFFTTKRGGTGLGLALSLEAMSRHGGHIRLTSPCASGRGARFSVEIPAQKPGRTGLMEIDGGET